MKKNKRITEDLTPNSSDFRWSITNSSACSTLQSSNMSGEAISRHAKMRGRPKKVNGKVVIGGRTDKTPDEKRLEISMISLTMGDIVVTRSSGIATGQVGGGTRKKYKKKNTLLHQQQIDPANVDLDDSLNVDLDRNVIVVSDETKKIDKTLDNVITSVKLGLSNPAKSNRLSQCANVSPLVSNSAVYECNMGGRKSFICVPISKDVGRISLVLAATDNTRLLRSRTVCNISHGSSLKRPLTRRMMKQSKIMKKTRLPSRNMSEISSLISLSSYLGVTGCARVDNLSLSSVTNEALSSPQSQRGENVSLHDSHKFEECNFTPSISVKMDRNENAMKTPCLVPGGVPHECSKDAIMNNYREEQGESSDRLSCCSIVLTDLAVTSRAPEEEEIPARRDSSNNVERGGSAYTAAAMAKEVPSLQDSTNLLNVTTPEDYKDSVGPVYVEPPEIETLSDEYLECESAMRESGEVLCVCSGGFDSDLMNPVFRGQECSGDESIGGAEDVACSDCTVAWPRVDISDHSLRAGGANWTICQSASHSDAVARCVSKIPVLRKEVSMMLEGLLPLVVLEKALIEPYPAVPTGAPSHTGRSDTFSDHLDSSEGELEVVPLEEAHILSWSICSRSHASRVSASPDESEAHGVASVMSRSLPSLSLTSESLVSPDSRSKTPSVEPVDVSVPCPGLGDGKLSGWSQAKSPLSARPGRTSSEYHTKGETINGLGPLATISQTRSPEACSVRSRECGVHQSQGVEAHSTVMSSKLPSASRLAPQKRKGAMSLSSQNHPSTTSSLSERSTRYNLRRDKEGDCAGAVISKSTTSWEVHPPSVCSVVLDDLTVPERVTTSVSGHSEETTMALRYNLRNKVRTTSAGGGRAVSSKKSLLHDSVSRKGVAVSLCNPGESLDHSVSQSVYHALAASICTTEELSDTLSVSERADIPFPHSVVSETNLSHSLSLADTKGVSNTTPSIARRPEEDAQLVLPFISHGSLNIPCPNSICLDSDESKHTAFDIAVAKSVLCIGDAALSGCAERTRLQTSSNHSEAVPCPIPPPIPSSIRRPSKHTRPCPGTAGSLAHLVDYQNSSRSSLEGLGPRVSPSDHCTYRSTTTVKPQTVLQKALVPSCGAMGSNRSYLESTRMNDVLMELNISISPICKKKAEVTTGGEESSASSDEDEDADSTDEDCLSIVEEVNEGTAAICATIKDGFYGKMGELKNNSAIEEESEDTGSCEEPERSFAPPRFVSLGLENLIPSVQKEVEPVDLDGERSLEECGGQSELPGASIGPSDEEESLLVLHRPTRHNLLSSLNWADSSLGRVSVVERCGEQESALQEESNSLLGDKRPAALSRSAVMRKLKCDMSFVNVTDKKCSQDGIVRRESKRTCAQTAGIYDTVVYRYSEEDKAHVISHRESRVSPRTVRRRQRLRDIASNVRAPCRRRRNSSALRHFARPDYMDLERYSWSPDGLRVSLVNPETGAREQIRAVISAQDFSGMSENFVEKRRHCLQPRFFSRRLLNDGGETVLEVKSCGATSRTAVVVVDECAIRVTSSQRLIVPRSVWFLVHNAGGSRITVVESVRARD